VMSLVGKEMYCIRKTAIFIISELYVETGLVSLLLVQHMLHVVHYIKRSLVISS